MRVASHPARGWHQQPPFLIGNGRRNDSLRMPRAWSSCPSHQATCTSLCNHGCVICIKVGAFPSDLVDNHDTEALGRLLRRGQTRIVWIETPSNPMGSITDIRATSELAHDAGALVVADGTLATPVLCQPLSLGADIVFHSATKQLNGHSDVLAGALVSREETELWQRIRFDRANRGAVLGPFEAWLLLRGMRTLFPRVRTSSRNAQAIASAMVDEESVAEVLYPGLLHHPHHELARRQMSGGFGFVVSLRIVGGCDHARSFANSLRLFRQASSLGGIESLVEHRASTEGPGTRVPDDLVRLSVGIESIEDLIADLHQALHDR